MIFSVDTMAPASTAFRMRQFFTDENDAKAFASKLERGEDGVVSVNPRSEEELCAIANSLLTPTKGAT